MTTQAARFGVVNDLDAAFGSAFIRAGGAVIDLDADADLPASVSRTTTLDAYAELDGADPDAAFPGVLASATDPIGPLTVTFDLEGAPPYESFVFPFEIDFGDDAPVATGLPADASGFDLPLGPVATKGDGSWAGGAVVLDDTTKVSDAVDKMNTVLGKLVPSAPPAFPNGTLTVSNTAGSTPLLASGVTDNSGSAPYTAGGAVTRITAAGVSCSTFNDVGPGESGTLSVLVNGIQAASHTLTGAGDNGTYSGLVISDQKDYPVATPGFWKSIDVGLSTVAASIGINKVKIVHSAAGNTGDVYFVRDGMTSVPTLSSTGVSEQTLGSVAYSSSVPHYGTGAQLRVAASIGNLSGETYYGGSDPLVISATGSIFSTVNAGYAALGITTPIARQTLAPVVVADQFVNIDGNVHGTGLVQITAKNVNGSSAVTTLSSKNILVKRGSAGSKIDENSVTVSGLGSSPNANNAARVGLGAGDTPAGAESAWVSSAALANHEAAVVAGVLKNDVTNYSVNYLPTGPDLSGAGRVGAQYVTFTFDRAALSAFKINVTGSYAGCWIKLPGVSDNAGISPNAPNGWWNAFQPYDGAGVPGETGDTACGCALGTVMSGASGAFQITFGTESSTHATGNEIMVRFKLNPGQSITALSFTS